MDLKVKNNKLEKRFCGEHYSSSGIKNVVLSPFPVSTNIKFSSMSNKLFRINNENILELNTQKMSVVFYQIILLSCLISSLFMLYMAREILFSNKPLAFLIIGGPYLILLGWLLSKMHDRRQQNKWNMPIKFNYQRKEILFSWVNGLKVRPTLLGGANNGGIDQGSELRLWSMILGGILFSTGLPISGGGRTYFLVSYISMFVGAVFLIFAFYPLIKYLLSSSYKNVEIHIESLAWEDVRIEYRECSVVSITGQKNHSTLVFICRIPNSSKDYFFSIPIESLYDAMGVIELLNNYMENGEKINEGCTTLSKENFSSEPESFLSNFWNLITLRKLALRLASKTEDTVSDNVKCSEEVKVWSSPLPRSKWKSFSREYEELNNRVKKLYSQGYNWEDKQVQVIIREYDKILRKN